MSRAARWAGLLALAAGLLGGAGCSLLLDLSADCVPEDCGGYQCNAEGTGCLTSCALDSDCDQGFLCDGGSCQAWGCSPDTAPMKLLDSLDDSQNLFPAWGDSGGDGTLATAQIIGGNLTLQLFSSLALELGPSRTLETAQSFPQTPWVTWNGQGWAVIWVTSLESGDRPQQQLRFALLDENAVVVQGPKTLWVTSIVPSTGETEKSIDDPKIYWDQREGRYLLTWSTRLTNSDLYLLALDGEGRDLEGNEEIPHEAAVRITRTGFDSVDPWLIPRAGTVYDVAYREGSPQVNVVVRSVELNGVRQGDDINVSMTQGQVGSHGLVKINTGSALAFAEAGTTEQVYRAQILGDRSLAGGEKLLIDRNFELSREASIVSGQGDEYAALFSAQWRGQRHLFLSRYKDDGARIRLPFPLTLERPRGPEGPRAAASRSGYFVVYRETEGPDAGAAFARHWSCQAP